MRWLRQQSSPVPVRKIVTAFVPFLCYLALFKNYNMLRAVTGLDEITKPSLTFLPWLENFVFHCMPHKIFASFHTPVLDVLAAVPYLIHFVLPVRTRSKHTKAAF